MEAPASRLATFEPDPALPVDVADALRLLFEQASDAAQPQPGHEAGAATVLDVHVNGLHYTITRDPVRGPKVNLSPREREIARLIAGGLPNKAIAAVLDISLWTVATYVRRLFSKLSVGTRAEMVARVLRDRLLEDGA
jgi:two-component system, NarL family, nitrate/nitrite response regulator NarL